VPSAASGVRVGASRPQRGREHHGRRTGGCSLWRRCRTSTEHSGRAVVTEAGSSPTAAHTRSGSAARPGAVPVPVGRGHASSSGTGPKPCASVPCWEKIPGMPGRRSSNAAGGGSTAPQQTPWRLGHERPYEAMPRTSPAENTGRLSPGRQNRMPATVPCRAVGGACGGRTGQGGGRRIGGRIAAATPAAGPSPIGARLRVGGRPQGDLWDGPGRLPVLIGRGTARSATGCPWQAWAAGAVPLPGDSRAVHPAADRRRISPGSGVFLGEPEGPEAVSGRYLHRVPGSAGRRLPREERSASDP